MSRGLLDLQIAVRRDDQEVIFGASKDILIPHRAWIALSRGEANAGAHELRLGTSLESVRSYIGTYNY